MTKAREQRRSTPMGVKARKEFFWCARNVMDADGLQGEVEVKLFLDISEALGKKL